ncbi:MAG: alpha-L-fucosidase, partial [Sphaerochaeta sp.]
MQTPIQSWSELGFGLFIHVGLYSILGGVYHGKPVTRGYSEQILSHGYVSQYDYEQLTAEFTFEAFDAKKIARVAQEAGMRYIVITTKHHDGFCLFHTKTTSYNSTNTPYGNDIVKELAEACKERGLGFGIYFSWIDWHYPHALPISAHNSDIITPLHQALNIAQLTELLTNYGPICELWMDMGAPSEEQSKEVSSLVKSLQPKCMVNGRIWNDFQDFLTMGDNQIPTLPLNCPWQTPASIYKETWGYRSWQERGDLNEKIAELTETLRQVRLMGGNYLLNIGLTGDG